MSILARFTPNSLTAEKYDEAVREMDEVNSPPEGRDYHVCFGSDGDLRVSEIWDSREQFEAYGEKLMPKLAEIGIDPGPKPEIIEIHNIAKR
jgi:hypothetical protein